MQTYRTIELKYQSRDYDWSVAISCTVTGEKQ